VFLLPVDAVFISRCYILHSLQFSTITSTLLWMLRTFIVVVSHSSCAACLCQLLLVKVKVKSFPGLMVPYCVGGDVKHCSINQSPIGRCWSLFNVALSWTPAEAARPWIQGYYISWYARLLPSFRWYSLTDPGVTAHWVGIGTLVQSTYGRDLNPWPCGCKSSALPHSH